MSENDGWRHVDAGVLLSAHSSLSASGKDCGVPESTVQQIANAMDNATLAPVQHQSDIAVNSTVSPSSTHVDSSTLEPSSVVNKLLSQGHNLIIKDQNGYREQSYNTQKLIID